MRVVLALTLAALGGCSFDASGTTRADGSVVTSDVAVDALPLTGPLLVGVAVPAPVGSRTDLTAEGVLDWLHLALTDKVDVDRKAAGGLQLNVSVLGGGERRAMSAMAFAWSDGSPHASASETMTALAVDGQGRGFTVLAPAGTETRRLRIYVAGNNTRGRMVATLSGGGAGPYVDETFQSAGGTQFAGFYELTYRASSDGQLMTATFTMSTDPGGASSVAMASATLR